MKMNENAREVIEEIAEEKGIAMDDVLIPPHKINLLWNDLTKDQFRDHMETSLEMLE